MKFDNEYFNLGYIDTLSYRDTFIHRLDPRTKVIVTFAFIVTVVSFHKYEIAGLAPFFLFPVLILSLGDIPVRFILKKVLAVSVFAVFIGIFNPLIDDHVMYRFYGLSVTGGWISFISIILKLILTISAALLLIATSSFPGVCRALQRLGMPDIFISQLMFLYRYIFVLMEETMRVVRARDMRSFGKKGKDIRVFVRIVGALFMRTVERAERIYNAMLSRGFNGRINAIKKSRFSVSDIIFLTAGLAALYLFRVYDITGALGRLLIRTV